MILNLIIAILSNTYNIFDTRSKGLYLSKILNARDDHPIDDEEFHMHYGSMLLTITPLNIILLPFVPYALFFKPSKYINNLLLISQYSVLINVLFFFFLIGSIMMAPFAYVKGIYMKIGLAMGSAKREDRIKNWRSFFLFLAFGMPILTINLFTDFYYFWMNNFRSNLKKIIIFMETSKLTS